MEGSNDNMKKLEHYLNPLHLYCRAIDKFKIYEPTAYRLSKRYEKFYKSKWSKRLLRSGKKHI